MRLIIILKWRKVIIDLERNNKLYTTILELICILDLVLFVHL